jgi:hypothetical protein
MLDQNKKLTNPDTMRPKTNGFAQKYCFVGFLRQKTFKIGVASAGNCLCIGTVTDGFF